MKEMRLERLALERFKGVERLEMKLEGKSATIFGENGAGKTTVADGYTWLLTNKMSNGRAAEYTPYASDGSLEVGANSVVEAAFTDGTILRRESNGVSRFYLNGVPMKQREYFEAVGELTKGAAGILALPQNFCKAHWAERRGILMELFGKIEASEVIAAEPALGALACKLERWTAEQIAEMSGAKIRALRSELAVIPARIDELERQASELGDREALEAAIADLEAKLAAATMGVKREQEKSRKALEPWNEANKLREAVVEIRGGVEETAAEARAAEAELKQLRKEWGAVSAALEGTCPVCGSKVPCAKADELRARLADISKRGKALAEKQEVLESGALAAKAKAAELEVQAERLQEQYETAEAQREGSPLEDAIEARDRIAGELNAAKLELGRVATAEKTQARIEELKAQEVELNGEIAALEFDVYLAQTFIATKIVLIEGAVNSQFEHVKFKMYERYKTAEGARECCEPVINGVPYGGNLSKGERLLAALDILKALQRAYGVELPVFIDDAESYTTNTAIELPNQVIRLAAAEGVKELRVAVEKPKAAPQQISLFEG